MKSYEKLVSKILLSTCAITTLAFTPFINIDPFAAPKLTILGTASSALVIILLFSNKLIFKVKSNYIFLLLILDLLLVYYFSGANKVEQFYGTVGRNFGLLAHLSLVVICITSANYCSLEIIKNFKKLLIIVSGINMAYGTIQLMGEDFVSNWTTTYSNSARGFFGNPNQYSSFTAIAALVSMSNILKKKRPVSEQLGSLSYILISIFHLYFSKSTQGPVVFGAGSLLLLFIFLKSNNYKNFNLQIYVVASLTILVCAILDIFQKSPWKPLLYSSTVSTRGDYWRAGIDMGLSHPFFGIGLDKYLEWYRISRDDVTFSRVYSAEVTDSAHNIFIDCFAFGGFPLLGIFILLNLFIVRKVVKIILNINLYDTTLTGLIIVYVGYLLQSLISPIHLGLAIWGWVSMGLILGVKLDNDNNVVPSKQKTINEKVGFSSKFISTMIVSTITGLLVSSLFMIQDMRFRSAIKQNSTVDRIYDSAYIWPKSSTRMAQASWLLYRNEFEEKSLKIALDAVKYSPNNYSAWLVLYSRTDLDPALKEVVLKNISRLEPRSAGIILLNK
jgi:O-antigen ligase